MQVEHSAGSSWVKVWAYSSKLILGYWMGQTSTQWNFCFMKHSFLSNCQLINQWIILDITVKEIFVMYKSQLQEYSQKAGLINPVYEHVKEGAPHEPRFQSTVCVNGQSYASAPGYPNLRAAEHAAAKVALDALQNSQTPGVIPSPVVRSPAICSKFLFAVVRPNDFARTSLADWI